MKQLHKTLFDIELPVTSKADTLEKVLSGIEKNQEFSIIMSLNPEILVSAQSSAEFKEAITASKIKIIDGVGVILAARLLNIPVGSRYTGVDLMADLVEVAAERRLRVMLIGGKENVAEELAHCYLRKYSNLNIRGIQGIKNIATPTMQEEEAIFSIVASQKPHLVLVAFGSPAQELWLFKNRAQFGKATCAGVGGAFDFLSGRVHRAPKLVRNIGMEWIYRLITQPWRWKRQLRLFKFWLYVLKQWFGQ